MKSYEKYIASTSEYFIYTPSRNARDMFFYPLQCGHFTYEPGYFLRRESYDSFLLMYIQKGKLTLEFENTITPVTEGHFVLLNCEKLHSYYTDTGWECVWCHYDGALALLWYENIVSKLGNVFTLPDTYPTFQKLNAIYDTFHHNHTISEPLLSKYLTDILTAFLLCTPAQITNNHYGSMIESTMAYMNEHFKEDISVEELARWAGLSQYHFIRTFKKETGFTPHEYLINARITTAKYLLKNSGMSVKDICFNTGFSCESVFCSAFKKNQGLTPKQYRGLE